MTKPYVISEPGGTITVSAAALEQVVQRAVEEAGARVRRRRLDIGGERVSVGIAVRYGAVLPEVAEDVQRRIADGLRAMCGIEAGAIDVSVDELAD